MKQKYFFRTLAVIAVLSLTGCGQSSSIRMKGDHSSKAACTNDNLGDCEIIGATKTLLEPNLIAANIAHGISIFGVLGTYRGPTSGLGAMNSNIHRDPAAIPWSLIKGSSTDAGAAYPASGTIRSIPSIMKDDDGYRGGSVAYVDRTGWGTNSCGTSQLTVELRIADCTAHPQIGAQAVWVGESSGNAGQSTWKLVTRTGNHHISGRSREVWRDERMGLLWSGLLSGVADNKIGGIGGGGTSSDGKYINWCKSSGSNFIAGNPAAEDDPINHCDNSSYQNTSGDAISACFEGAGFTNIDTISNVIDSGGKAGLGMSSTPAVSWRLPTLYDYQQASIDGIRFVLAEMGPNSWSDEWTATIRSENRDYAWMFEGQTGSFEMSSRNYNSYGVRCVGR